MAASFDKQMSIQSTFFSRCSESEYAQATVIDNWNAFVAAGRHGVRVSMPEVLSYSDYRHFFNQVLTPGMPGALPPVESLYKDWGGHKAGLQHGQGFYLGDSARHAQQLLDTLQIDIPKEYFATPDHLLILLELYGFLLEHASAGEAQSFATSHFDWLDIYCNLLDKRLESETDESLKAAGVFYQGLICYIEDMVTSEQAVQSA